jgi:hypothetical protein
MRSAYPALPRDPGGNPEAVIVTTIDHHIRALRHYGTTRTKRAARFLMMVM